MPTLPSSLLFSAGMTTLFSCSGVHCYLCALFPACQANSAWLEAACSALQDFSKEQTLVPQEERSEKAGRATLWGGRGLSRLGVKGLCVISAAIEVQLSPGWAVSLVHGASPQLLSFLWYLQLPGNQDSSEAGPHWNLQ